MNLLVCYDIADDSRRERIVRVLLDYGQRVQESVFWIDVEDENLVGRMVERLKRAILESEDSLWIVRLCEGCAKRIQAFGTSKRPELPEYYVF